MERERQREIRRKTGRNEGRRGGKRENGKKEGRQGRIKQKRERRDYSHLLVHFPKSWQQSMLDSG